MASPLSGVAQGDIGPKYDIAIGWDTGTQIQMFGYVVSDRADFNEKRNLNDDQRIVQVASPNSTDRYTSYPKVTQGDWSGGEGQLVFADATKYYQSYGVDITKPGFLQLYPASTVYTATIGGAGAQSRAPSVSDGMTVVTAYQLSSVVAEVMDSTGATAALGPTAEILFAHLGPSGGAFFAGGSGIYQIASPIAAAAGTQWTSDVVEPTATQGMAYMSSATANGLYYIRNDNKLCWIGAAVGNNPTPNAALYTGLAMEQKLRFLCSTATGLLFATQSAVSVGDATNPRRTCYLYSWDGSTATRVADFVGKIHAGYEMNGITYLLVELQQQFSYDPQITLMAYSSSGLSIINDLRYALPDFQAKNFSFQGYSYGGSLGGDGRFIYIGWPGLYPLAYDTIKQSFARVGNAALQQSHVTGHRLFPTGNGLVDVVAANGQLIISVDRASPLTGTLTSSWMDFGVPDVVKAFRSVEVELVQPVPTGATIGIAYRTDNASTFTTVPTSAVRTLPNGNLMFMLPAATKGLRFQWQITLNAGSSTSPVVRTVAVNANLARVWDVTLNCLRNQRTRTTLNDSQATMQDLLANIQNAYEQASGMVVLFVPDPTQPSGVSQVNAKIEDCSRVVPQGVAPGRRDADDGAGEDMEGIVSVTLVEQL